jgi:Uncharacterized protein conserved in bacteria (DUF2218)
MIGSDGRMCNPEATPDVFTLRAETPDVEALERLQRVVVEHIKRFAFREDLGEVQWTPTNKTLDVSLTAPLHRGQGSAVMAAASVPTNSSIVG